MSGMRTLSFTVMLVKGRGSWKLRAMPRWVRWFVFRPFRGAPLKRSVPPDEAHALAELDVQADVLQRQEAAEALAEIVDLEERFSHYASLLRNQPWTSPTSPLGAMMTKA